MRPRARRPAVLRSGGRLTGVVVALALVVPLTVGAQRSALSVLDGDAYARIEDGRVVLGNAAVERVWQLDPFGTVSVTDRRSGLSTGASPDLRLVLADGVELTGDDFRVERAVARRVEGGGVAVDFELSSLLGSVARTVTVYPAVAGFRTDTEVAIAGALAGYTLEELTLPGATATSHHFNAGYDWRGSDTPDWEPSIAPFGGAHTGDHRETTSGSTVDTRAQWLTVDAGGPRAFIVTERVNYDSTRVVYDGTSARSVVDLSHDVAYLGPFESDLHVASPVAGHVGRVRAVTPSAPLRLETVFTGFAADADDEPWQYHRYLIDHRAPAWDRAITFNSNGVDRGRISTGAKDDMDLAEVVRQAEVARRIGVEIFILDDGWQAASGDWCPDSPPCPEPRKERTGYPDRFPDDTFRAVRDVLGDMDLGLWMSPMHFNPASHTYGEHPEWACTPVGDGLVAYNTLEPDSSSNEAGLGTWSPDAIPKIERDIHRMIEVYGARELKFDFLVWLDCLETDPADVYGYRGAFVAMVDRILADHPDVTIQIDETNDYRLWPFESVARGPAWYANGGPTVDELLHNLWVNAPYVPPSGIGQAVAQGHEEGWSADERMQIALLSHITFFDDLTAMTEEEVTAAARWMAVYRDHRDAFTAGVAYPLLDDPLGGTTWSALQIWDLDAQRGSLQVVRQDTPDATRTVALRGVRGEGAYRLSDAGTGQTVATVSARQLRAGIPITLTEPDSVVTLLVDRIGPAPR